MNFKKHYDLEGQHAFLGASKYHWINYTDDKLVETYKKHLAVLRGTELHEFAATAIRLQQPLKSSSRTLNKYVNDAIGYRMSPEVVLYYSDNCFGTADTISFRKNLLRIHDLKTGETPASMKQLYVYAALFCLEYNVKPAEIKMETRIYQSDDIFVENPTVEDILPIMDRIITGDKLINQLKEEIL